MSTLFLNISYLHLLIIDTLWVFRLFQLSSKTSLKYLKSSYSSNILQYLPYNNIVINCNCMKGSLHCLTQQTFILYLLYSLHYGCSIENTLLPQIISLQFKCRNTTFKRNYLKSY